MYLPQRISKEREKNKFGKKLIAGSICSMYFSYPSNFLGKLTLFSNEVFKKKSSEIFSFLWREERKQSMCQKHYRLGWGCGEETWKKVAHSVQKMSHCLMLNVV